MTIDGTLFEDDYIQTNACTKRNHIIQHYFANSAPCLITRNINTNIGIINGTFVYNSTFETTLEYINGNKVSIYHIKSETTYKVY